MSIINVWREPSRVLVGVDTLAGACNAFGQAVKFDGAAALMPRQFEVSKMLGITHLNAILALRGTALLLNQIYAWCGLLPGQGLDDLFKAFPEVLSQSLGLLQRQLGASIGHQWDAPQEVVLCGWSNEHSKMLARAYVHHAGTPGFAETEIDEVWLAPWDDAVQGDPIDCDCPHNMHKLMSLQVLDARTRFPEVAAGGRCLIAELSQRSLRTVDAGMLP